MSEAQKQPELDDKAKARIVLDMYGHPVAWVQNVLTPAQIAKLAATVSHGVITTESQVAMLAVRDEVHESFKASTDE